MKKEKERILIAAQSTIHKIENIYDAYRVLRTLIGKESVDIPLTMISRKVEDIDELHIFDLNIKLRGSTIYTERSVVDSFYYL